MTDGRLAELLAIANDATPGPWPVSVTHTANSHYVCGSGPWRSTAGEEVSARADALFIAAAREAVPLLIAALREARERTVAYTCAACGGIGYVRIDSLDSGTTLTCDCGGKTVVDLATPEERKARAEQPMETP